MTLGCRWLIVFLSIFGCTLTSTDDLAEVVGQNVPWTEKALLSDRVNAVAADAEHVWVATDKGVNRFNKKVNSWMSYTVEDGLANNRVSSAAVDGDAVWFGTDAGISKYEPKLDKWTTYNRDDGLPSNRILAVGVDGNYVWFGTDKGLSRYNKTIGVWALRTIDDGGLTSNEISDIAVGEEYVWFATDEGVSRYDKKIDSWTQLTKSDGLADGHVTTIAIDEDFIWFGTQNAGVSLYSNTEQTFVKTYTRNDLLETDKINYIMGDGLYVWIGTANEGVQRYVKPADTWIHYGVQDGLPSLNITAMAVDSKYIWFGTYEDGLARFDKIGGLWKTVKRTEGLVSDNVKSIAEQDGILWIGTAMGLSRFDSHSGQWATYTKAQGLTTNYITRVVAAGDAIWVGTSKGLGRYQNKRWKFWGRQHGLPSDFVHDLAVVNQVVWVGTRNGLCRYDIMSDRWHICDGLRNTWINGIAVDDSTLWLATNRGLAQLTDLTNTNPTNVRVKFHESHITDYVNTALAVDGVVWIGTQHGLSRYDAAHHSKWHHYTVEDGLPNNNVRTLAVSEDALWVGTPSGLVGLPRNVRNPLSTTESDEWRIFDLTQPGAAMGHENVRDICAADGEIWLATIGGLGVYSLEYSSWRAIRAAERTTVLRHSDVHYTEPDGNWVWFLSWPNTSNGGIVRYDKRTRTWGHYMKEDVTPIGQNDETPYISQINWMEVTADSVWFATDGGVLVYHKMSDTWRHYTTSDGLGANKTTTLLVDETDVWVVLRDNRICRYQRNTDRWDTHQVVFKEIAPGMESYRTRIAADVRYVWAPAQMEGVARYDKVNQSWRRYTSADGLSSGTIAFIAVDNNDVWAYGGASGLSKYDENTDSWSVIDDKKGLASDRVREVISGVDFMWVLHDRRWWEEDDYAPASGFHRANQTWQSFRGHPDNVGNNFTDVQEMREVVWFGSNNHGVSRYDKASSSWTVFTEEDGLLNNRVIYPSLKVDGNFLWMGGGSGISRYDMRDDSWTVFTGRASLPSDVVHAVAVDSRYIYCGTDRGATRYDKRYDRWLDKRIVEDPVNALAADDKYLWIATAKGVTRFDKSAHLKDLHDVENGLADTFVKVADVGRHNLWVGTEKGVSRYNTLSDDPNAWETFTQADDVDTLRLTQEYADSLVYNRVTSIAVGDRFVWVGTEKGVSRHDMRKGIWITYKKNNGLHDDEVSSIRIDGNSVWFGAAGGVSRLDTKTDEWRVFTPSDGLASGQITCIAASDDFVWFGTFDSGVCRYDKATAEWMNFTQRDGLSHNRVFALAVDGDFLWIGTERGLSRYDTMTDTWTIFTKHFDREDDRR